VGEIFRFGRVIVRVWSNDHFPPHVEVFWPSMRKPEAHAKFSLETLNCMESNSWRRKGLVMERLI
jgi:hypothetical protein